VKACDHAELFGAAMREFHASRGSDKQVDPGFTSQHEQALNRKIPGGLERLSNCFSHLLHSYTGKWVTLAMPKSSRPLPRLRLNRVAG